MPDFREFAALLALLMLILLFSVDAAAQATAAPAIVDPHSYARPQEVAVKHLALDLNVDFSQKKLAGTAALTIENKTRATELHLDTRDLDVTKVTLGPGNSTTKFRLGDTVEFLGRELIIEIGPETRLVTVHYSTRPSAAALQWLEPAQTAGRKHPFLFTQSQAILARTWAPVQDTPSVRFTYDATVRVPRELLAVMSADNPTTKNADGIYRFKMPEPIPSYLLALAVGDLEFRALGPRAGVYAEPAVVKQAAWEFADTPKMIDAAEKLYGPYRWGRYDLLILPPSFPFGGMENPRLTFATPTIIAKDRSLVSLVAHELAHSWSGNLVTNATWNDFWLNEGFTVYFEQRIMEALYGREYAEMLAIIELGELQTDMKSLKPADTHLLLDLKGRDPDEGMNQVAYVKGAMFLRMLEEAVGRQRFDRFLRAYFDKFAFQSMTTEQFLDYLRANLLNSDQQLEARLKIDAWVNGPGLPSNAPQPKSARLQKVEAQAAKFSAGTPAKQLATKGWSTQEWLHFLRSLGDLDVGKMAALDAAFKFTHSGNAEVTTAWLLKAIQAKYEAAYPRLEEFLTTVGRRKLLKPLYEALARTPEGKQMARRIYTKARPGYHAVSQQTIDQILGYKPA
jgi:leukotriene A-4 hydrolase/aminopeptidase